MVVYYATHIMELEVELKELWKEKETKRSNRHDLADMAPHSEVCWPQEGLP